MKIRSFVLRVMTNRTAAFGVPPATSAATASAVLTLDEAIALALRDNRQVKNSQLGVGKAQDDFAATRTYRLPKLSSMRSPTAGS